MHSIAIYILHTTELHVIRTFPLTAASVISNGLEHKTMAQHRCRCTAVCLVTYIVGHKLHLAHTFLSSSSTTTNNGYFHP